MLTREDHRRSLSLVELGRPRVVHKDRHGMTFRIAVELFEGLKLPLELLVRHSVLSAAA
jgi:hypothetical protein